MADSSVITLKNMNTTKVYIMFNKLNSVHNSPKQI